MRWGVELAESSQVPAESRDPQQGGSGGESPPTQCAGPGTRCLATPAPRGRCVATTVAAGPAPPGTATSSTAGKAAGHSLLDILLLPILPGQRFRRFGGRLTALRP